MDKLDHAPSTLSLQSCDTGICCEDFLGADLGLPINSSRLALESGRILAPSFEAIRNAFGKLYDINDFDLEKIASGFFGDVYKANYKPTGEVMVVKCNKKNQGKMFREVELMRKLGDHPNIIKFKGGCVDGARVYSLTEYMNGGTLEQLLTSVDDPITWPQREKLCHDIAAGMQYLHAKKYMHRDLTTKNILIQTDAELSKTSEHRFLAVVADFGLATEIPQRQQLGNSCSSQNNKPLAVVGSAWWMAPECIELAIKAKFSRFKERGYNERVDVFSYGIVVCQVCARIEADPEYLQRTANYGVDYVALSKLVEDDPIARYLMLLAIDCTKYQPEDRPTFAQISERLSRSRQHGPGHHLIDKIDKRFRRVQVRRRPASSVGPVSNNESVQQISCCERMSATAGISPLATEGSAPVLSTSQLPQVWVHTVIRTIDPDFRPARSNPFAALEDHFRDGRKMVRLASIEADTDDSTTSSVWSPPPFYHVPVQLFGSLSEGFGDSASSMSMSLSPGDQFPSCASSLRAVKSPPFTPVHFSHVNCTSSGSSQQPMTAVLPQMRSIIPNGACSPPPYSASHYTFLGAESKQSQFPIRSLPNSMPSSPCAARRAKSVYVGSNTSIRFFPPEHRGDTPVPKGEDVTDLRVLSARNSAISRSSQGQVNRVVWSRVRFFETLSQEQQKRWHMMIANNKIAEEQRRAAAESDSST